MAYAISQICDALHSAAKRQGCFVPPNLSHLSTMRSYINTVVISVEMTLVKSTPLYWVVAHPDDATKTIYVKKTHEKFTTEGKGGTMTATGQYRWLHKYGLLP